MKDKIKDYLMLIKEMEEIPGMYGLDNMRVQLHLELDKAISDYYDEKVNHERTAVLFSNLDKVIPLPMRNTTEVYQSTTDLYKLIVSTKCKYFLTGKTKRMTVWGEIIE